MSQPFPPGVWLAILRPLILASSLFAYHIQLQTRQDNALNLHFPKLSVFTCPGNTLSIPSTLGLCKQPQDSTPPVGITITSQDPDFLSPRDSDCTS